MAIVGAIKYPERPDYSWMPKRKAIPKKIRQLVFDKCQGHCGYCGEELGKRWCVDHMHAHYLGGQDDLSNLMPACFPCNNLKHSFSIDGFRKEISAQIERGMKSSLNFRTAKRFGLISVIEKPVIFYFETLT